MQWDNKIGGFLFNIFEIGGKSSNFDMILHLGN